MAISKDKKGEILDELTENFKNAKSVVFASNDGLSVLAISEFRNKLREKKAKYQIAKKTLIRIAAKNNNLPDLPDNVLEGPIGVIFSPEDELFPAKSTFEFAKLNKKLLIKGGVFFNGVVDASEIEALAKIPPREELLAKLVGCMQAPLANFIGTGKSLISSFVRVCNEVSKQKA